MSSSPPVPLRSPNRITPKRSPLQERTRSEANEISSRLVRDPRNDPGTDIFSVTPYPTKAAHVLLPSTIRKQRGGNGAENALHTILGPSVQSSAIAVSLKDRGDVDRAKANRPPALALKRSVATLRDMYEAQAERSRPSTAASPPLRPTTANSIRLRSSSSSDGLSGRYAWEALHKASSDDLALLPSLAEAVATVKKITSESSFQSRVARNLNTSSPNFVAIGSSSSPKIPVFNDLSSPNCAAIGASSSPKIPVFNHLPRPNYVAPGKSSSPTHLVLHDFSRTVVGPDDLISSPEPALKRSSTPNLVQLGRSSSFDEPIETSDEVTERSSSPNFIKLGSSSPSNTATAVSSSSPPPVVLAQSPKKRKRDDEGPSFAARVEAANVIASSPPYDPSTVSSSAQEYPSPDNSIALPSSPPGLSSHLQALQESSPAEESRKISYEGSSENHSLADTHASLQAALTSSPVPAIQYPVVRAPPASAFSGLSVPKRPPRSSIDPISPRWTSRLSTVPSEWSGGRTNSKRSSFVEDLEDDYSDTGSNYAASRVFLTENPEANESCIRMVPVSDPDDTHEASDEVSALPGHHFQQQSQHLSPVPPTRHSSFLGTSSYLGTISSPNTSGSRLNSMRNSMDNRLNSMKSFTNSRHNSLQSSSQRPSSSSSVITNFPVPSWARRYYSGAYQQNFQHMYYSPVQGVSTTNLSVSVSGRPSTSASKRSERSARDRFPLNIFRARPRVEPRQSHVEPGLGPLVSNPVRKRLPPPAATYHNTPGYHNSYPSAMTLETDLRPTRTVSLHPADPRAHWAGITPEQLQALHDEIESVHVPPSRESSLIPRRNRASEWSPHLHRGQRSSFQHRMWHAPSVNSAGEAWFSWRNLQVILFLFGFVCPIAWFVAAFLPLPRRPAPEDLEEARVHEAEKDHRSAEAGDLNMDLEMRLRRQIARADQLRWENANWWRGLNRFMCAVGVVVIAVVVTLAVLGTRDSGW